MTLNIFYATSFVYAEAAKTHAVRVVVVTVYWLYETYSFTLDAFLQMKQSAPPF